MINLENCSRSLLVVLAGCVLALSVAVRNPRESRCRRTGGETGQDGGEDVQTNPQPTAIATWRFGKIAVDAAAALLQNGGTALDATEAGDLVRTSAAIFVECDVVAKKLGDGHHTEHRKQCKCRLSPAAS